MRKIVYLAYRDRKDRMTPVSRNGMLTVFPSWKRADAAKGPLGVWVPTEWNRIAEICKEYRLKMPPEPKEIAVQLPGF